MKFTVGAEKQAELARLFERVGLREDDLEERFVRASGPGGQKVNKTSSAVYLKHLPSGMEVKVQTARSQMMNRFTARRLLAQRMEAQILGKKSAETAKIEKLRRQKRKRSKRAKAKMLDNKSAQGEKKAQRKRPSRDD